MRTGSNFLEANLNALPGVTCHGEAFNPHFIGKLNQTDYLGVSLQDRLADPARLIARMREATGTGSGGLSGFRYFHDHDPRVLPLVMEDPAGAKIVLTRNPVESYVSWKIAQATNQWKLTKATKLKSAKARFDIADFEQHLEALQQFQITLLHGLQTTGQTAFYIDYEDINDTDVLNGLARFLGVEGRLAAPDNTLKKQNPEEIEEKVENFPEMEAALARLDRFNLARTPNFEPRRAPAIPSFVAAKGALYMPLRGGPTAQIENWLAALGPVARDFNQKLLRQWQRRETPHRAFTVLRHPLARAHAGFCDMILTAKLPMIREALIKTWKIPLPKPGEALDRDAHRDLFLQFLGFLKQNVSGQSGLRVDPNFASQTAVLQGFAQFQPPDLVLREDRLAEGLAHLCAELGRPCPPLPDRDEPSLKALAAIHGPDLEAAARDAYARDYAAFGFSDWAP